jgi:5'(3')-deoxyribonucleotidase
MKNKAKILIDMDGVVADFVGGICKAHNRENPYEKGFTGYQIEEAWGITPDEFWKVTDNVEFWDGLDKFEWADELIEHCENLVGIENMAFCTAPSRNPLCIVGKSMWLDRYFPKVKRIFTKEKYFCANPQTILIDDTDAKIEKFYEHGGIGVNFPQPWNQATLGGLGSGGFDSVLYAIGGAVDRINKTIR